MEEELVPFLSGRKRKVRKQYSLLYRYLGMRPNELYRERNMKKWFRNLILLDAIVDDRSDEAEIEEILEILFMNILHLTTERPYKNPQFLCFLPGHSSRIGIRNHDAPLLC